MPWSPCGRVGLVISGGLAPDEIRELCIRLQGAFSGNGIQEVACDVGGIVDADAAAIDAIARLQLAARRCGGHLRLRNACCALQELIAFAGLCDVLPSRVNSVWRD